TLPAKKSILAGGHLRRHTERCWPDPEFHLLPWLSARPCQGGLVRFGRVPGVLKKRSPLAKLPPLLRSVDDDIDPAIEVQVAGGQRIWNNCAGRDRHPRRKRAVPLIEVNEGASPFIDRHDVDEAV